MLRHESRYIESSPADNRSLFLAVWWVGGGYSDGSQWFSMHATAETVLATDLVEPAVGIVLVRF